MIRYLVEMPDLVGTFYVEDEFMREPRIVHASPDLSRWINAVPAALKDWVEGNGGTVTLVERRGAFSLPDGNFRP